MAKPLEENQMIVTLNYRAPLGLPSGVTLQPGVPTPVHGWEQDVKSRVVQAWIKAGILKLGDGQRSQFVSEPEPQPAPGPDQQPEPEPELAPDAQEPEPEQSPADEKADLIAALEAKGIKVDKRMGIAKLKALLAES